MGSSTFSRKFLFTKTTLLNVSLKTDLGNSTPLEIMLLMLRPLTSCYDDTGCSGGGILLFSPSFIIHRTTEVRIGSEGKNWHAIDIRIHPKKASTLHAQCDTFDTKCCMAFDNDSRAEQSMCCRKRRLSSDTMLSTWLVQNKTSRRSWKNAEKRDQKEEEQMNWRNRWTGQWQPNGKMGKVIWSPRNFKRQTKNWVVGYVQIIVEIHMNYWLKFPGKKEIARRSIGSSSFARRINLWYSVLGGGDLSRVHRESVTSNICW